MDRWLADFAYRTGIDPITFALIGLLALAIAWITIGYQAIRAALTNPADALKYE